MYHFPINLGNCISTIEQEGTWDRYGVAKSPKKASK